MYDVSVVMYSPSLSLIVPCWHCTHTDTNVMHPHRHVAIWI